MAVDIIIAVAVGGREMILPAVRVVLLVVIIMVVTRVRRSRRVIHRQRGSGIVAVERPQQIQIVTRDWPNVVPSALYKQMEKKIKYNVSS